MAQLLLPGAFGKKKEEETRFFYGTQEPTIKHTDKEKIVNLGTREIFLKLYFGDSIPSLDNMIQNFYLDILAKTNIPGLKREIMLERDEKRIADIQSDIGDRTYFNEREVDQYVKSILESQNLYLYNPMFIEGIRTGDIFGMVGEVFQKQKHTLAGGINFRMNNNGNNSNGNSNNQKQPSFILGMNGYQVPSKSLESRIYCGSEFPILENGQTFNNIGRKNITFGRLLNLKYGKKLGLKKDDKRKNLQEYDEMKDNLRLVEVVIPSDDGVLREVMVDGKVTLKQIRTNAGIGILNVEQFEKFEDFADYGVYVNKALRTNNLYLIGARYLFDEETKKIIGYIGNLMEERKLTTQEMANLAKKNSKL